MANDRISRAIRHLERNTRLDMEPSSAHVQVVKNGVSYYMPNTFHMAPTMRKMSLNTQGKAPHDRLETIVEHHDNYVPMLVAQLASLKQLRNVYYHNYQTYEQMRVFLYLNWPIRDVCVLGKVLDIREAEISESTTMDPPIPVGPIKSNEYLLFIEDGTSQQSVTVRMSHEVWNAMKLGANPNLVLGAKVKVSGMVNVAYNQLEVSATKVVVVGNPQNLSVETEWWKLCLEMKAMLDMKWNFNPLGHVEYPDLDIVVSFTQQQSIIDVDDFQMSHDQGPTWVSDMDCSFDEFLALSLSSSVDIPSNDDVEMVVFENILALCVDGSSHIKADSLQSVDSVFHSLVLAITSTMAESWSQLSDDGYLASLWKATDFATCISVLLQQHLIHFSDLGMLHEEGDLLSLEPLNSILAAVENKLSLLPVGSAIGIGDIYVLLQVLGVRYEEKYVSAILQAAVSGAVSKKGVFWKSSSRGYKKHFTDSPPCLQHKTVFALHNRHIVPTTEQIKCVVFKQILKQNCIDLHSLIMNYEIKVKLNTLILSKISDTCGSMANLDDVLKFLETSRLDFEIMKRRILVAIFLFFEKNGIIKFKYDGYFDRQALVDYNFKTIAIECQINCNELLIPERDFQTSEIRESFRKKGIVLNRYHTNCLINHVLQINDTPCHFHRGKGTWMHMMT